MEFCIDGEEIDDIIGSLLDETISSLVRDELGDLGGDEGPFESISPRIVSSLLTACVSVLSVWFIKVVGSSCLLAFLSGFIIGMLGVVLPFCLSELFIRMFSRFGLLGSSLRSFRNIF